MKAGKFQMTATAFAVGAALTFGASGAAWADSVQDQINDLDQKIRILQRQQEIKSDDAATKAKDSKTVTAGYDSKGFVLKTGDGNNEFRVNGFAQFDSRWYVGDHPNAAAPIYPNTGTQTNTQTGELNTFTTRRLRLVFSGTIGKYYSYYLQPSFDGGGAGLQDAWVNAAFKPYFQLRFGKFKLPFGLERLQSSSNNSLVEAGFTTWLTPNYENGVQVLGTVNTGYNALDYQLAYTNGASNENESTDSDSDGNKSWAIRLFDSPFKNSDGSLLQGLGFGLAYAKSRLSDTNLVNGGVSSTVNNGAVAGNQLTVPNYNNVIPGLGNWDNYGNALLEPGSDIRRLSPQGYWYGGPFGILAEYVAVTKSLYKTATPVAGAQDVKNKAWQVVGTWVVTGETPTYNSGITPKHAFLKDGGTGAVELVARYQKLTLDGANFTDANGATTNAVLNRYSSVSEAKGIGASVNWYLAKGVKLQVNFDKFSYTGGGGGTLSATSGTILDRKSDKTLFTRAQFAF